MSIIKFSRDNFENYELVARPEKVFRSSSDGGLEGDILLMKDASPSLKDISRKEVVTSSIKKGKTWKGLNQYDDSVSDSFVDLFSAGGPASEEALRLVNQTKTGLRYRKRQEIFRTIPGTQFNKTYLKKRVVKNNLMPYYRAFYESMEWAYTNYHCLNFFENTNVPSESALIYPALTESSGESSYAPSSSFTIEFYVKPRENSDAIRAGSEVSPGTILHMSSCYAVSLVTGSSTGPDGKPDGYRVLLQLSESADINPSNCIVSSNQVSAGNTSCDKSFIFASSDNSLSRDVWSHVAIRWPGSSNNMGSGSFVINGKKDSDFVITSSIVMQTTTSIGSNLGNPDAVFIGNYFSGENSGNSTIARFFNNTAGRDEGVSPILSGALGDIADPVGFKFTSPLRAELHEIKIFDKFRSLPNINKDMKTGVSKIGSSLKFYVPPFFIKESRRRNILQTPFFTEVGKTDDPFNIPLSFGLGSLDINVENFVREMVKKEYPRLWNLTASADNSVAYEEGKTSNDVIYGRQGSARKRLRTVMPCDNGMFYPDFSFLKTGSNSSSKFTDSYGSTRLDLISLESMVTPSTLLKDLAILDDSISRTPGGDGSLVGGPAWGQISDEGSSPFGPKYFLNDLVGANPQDPSLAPGAILSVLQRTGDPSSSEVVMFDISNMFYGDSITPGSLLIEDLAPTGSEGSFTLKVRDNSYGNLYRADVKNPEKAARWASVGNVFYEEGIVLIKSPHLAFFGKEDFRITFKGEKTVYVLEIIVPVEASKHNSSSNPTYKDLSPTDYSNETSRKFTYISSINLHDDNLNVIGKANLSQPFLKRNEDKVVIKLRMDF
jgi:hypothetical protein